MVKRKKSSSAVAERSRAKIPTRRKREALAVEDLTDAELEAISKAEVTVPNRKTVEAMKAARRGELATFGSVDELMADLNSDD